MSHRRLVDDVVDDLSHTMKALRSLRDLLPRPADGVENSAYLLLFMVKQQPARITVLAERLGSDVSTISRQVGGLMSAGLVEKRPDPDDGRAHLVGLTSRGEQLVAAMRDSRREWFGRIFDGWDEAELQQFATQLRRLRTSVVDERCRLAGHDPAAAQDGGCASDTTTTKETA